jgi:hypothetical protein
VKSQQIHQLFIQFINYVMAAPTCFGITLPSSGSIPSAFWVVLNWGEVDRILWMGVLCLVTASLDTTRPSKIHTDSSTLTHYLNTPPKRLNKRIILYGVITSSVKAWKLTNNTYSFLPCLQVLLTEVLQQANTFHSEPICPAAMCDANGWNERNFNAASRLILYVYMDHLNFVSYS